jgi:hypothetical protein
MPLPFTQTINDLAFLFVAPLSFPKTEKRKEGGLEG